MQKQGLPMEQDMIIQKVQEIHHYMCESMHSVVSVGRGWCDQFMIWHQKLTLRTAHAINQARIKESLEGLQSFFCELHHHIIGQKIKRSSCGIWIRLDSFRSKTHERYLYWKTLSICGKIGLMRIFTWIFFMCFRC